MSDRLPTGVLVGALLRRANDAGGMAMVLARGDDQAGSMLLILREKWAFVGMAEPGRNLDGAAILTRVGPDESADAPTIDDYWKRRRARDPDLWVIELDIPSAERFAAETIFGG
ncbi:DUF1491 family protein [Sphingomonas immobilis]|uniref:DUF1491 family protein n=1 Tax=Sphingomonas immobilis TaxID=3063997 RepID=A0ABT8ZW02_9SPHN|nr:DUF1491 family protein [Sphingomonas sp. CA1-15]MDO7841397.1 DUF1491 family protein [Sphingomonas sp. CA1-15]